MINQNNLISVQKPLNENDQNNQVKRNHLTSLPTVLWSLAASFLELDDLRNLTLTNRIFVEGASKLSDELKEIIKECISESSLDYYRDNDRFSGISKATSFSLPVVFQLKSLKSINTRMVKIYQQSVSIKLQPLGRDVFSKCESLISLIHNTPEDNSILNAIDYEVCPNLNTITIERLNFNLDEFLIVNGKRLLEINIKIISKNFGNINAIIDHCPNLTSLSSFDFNNDFLLKLSSLPKLTCLKTTTWANHLNCENLIPLISSREMLKLNLIEVPLTQKFIDVLSQNARKLKDLSLIQKNLRHFKFTELFSNLTCIEKLNLRKCNINDRDLNLLLENTTNLLHLNVRDNPQITENGIKKIKKSIKFWDISNKFFNISRDPFPY